MSGNTQNFKICSINVNGLNDVRKRRLVFNNLRKLKNSIILLQETHCRPGNGRLWKSQWGSSLFLNETSGNSGGVATLFSRDLDPKFLEIVPSTKNRFLITKFTMFGETYKIVNLYMPTADRERNQLEVLQELNTLLESDEDSLLFIGGDLNLVFDEALDRSGYSLDKIINKQFPAQLFCFMENYDIQDIWRVQNPQAKVFSWSRTDKLVRLDYLLTPESFPGQIRDSRPQICSYSDHRMIAITIRPSIQPRGRGFWKLRTSLLHREDYCKEVVEWVDRAKKDSVGLSPDNRWEFIKMRIREGSIKFARQLKEKTMYLETELETRLIALEKELDSSGEVREEFHDIKRELYQIQLIRARESMIRARTRWVGKGERPTKYFLNLEKKSFTAKTMTAVLDERGNRLTDPDDILAFEKRHFTSQYALDPSNLEAHARGEDVPFLQPSERSISDLDRVLLNRDISLEELEFTLKEMNKGKAPGCDGIPPEFYKKFWGILGPNMLQSFLYSFDSGILSPNQRRGIISLIPNKGKDKVNIWNWRPISMLNADFKILAKALARCLSSVIPSLINPNQTGFTPFTLHRKQH